ncbi:hypothetical protein SAMN05421780_11112 [Flexibacter flexilis DSM 6793]|uniref:Uncharacterized protein n=1 Tax=Flexibacter flexilis DSM 6793 TaxID=927664 RepID=A0A1I1MPM5_9BACT|nr:hypothetical protein [Flexibacter flexilis]SFC86812.1 hypothetical protein SAMN05421780_11112 [Flexibacter flexilis DSM 6793]
MLISDKKAGRVLLPSSESDSLFVMQLYYNENHYKSKTQNIARFWSMDFEDERNGTMQYETLNEYNGYIKFIQYVQKLNVSGRLWRAFIYYNTILDPNGKPELITGFAGTKPKNFLTQTEAYSGLTMEQVQTSRTICTDAPAAPIELDFGQKAVQPPQAVEAITRTINQFQNHY